MLLGTFFTIKETHPLENNSYRLTVELDAGHEIFSGHFPGNPIVPGVCLTQMVKEIIEFTLTKTLNMVKGDNIKFTAIVDPRINSVLDCKLSLKQLENEMVQAELSFFSGDITFYKFKGSFVAAK